MFSLFNFVFIYVGFLFLMSYTIYSGFYTEKGSCEFRQFLITTVCRSMWVYDLIINSVPVIHESWDGVSPSFTLGMTLLKILHEVYETIYNNTYILSNHKNQMKVLHLSVGPALVSKISTRDRKLSSGFKSIKNREILSSNHIIYDCYSRSYLFNYHSL